MPGALPFLAGGGEMGAMIRQYPWCDTPLGPPARWSPALRIAVRLMLDARQPAHLLWGEDAIWLYNDAARATLGDEEHPAALGQPAYRSWTELWPSIGPQIDLAMLGGRGSLHENQAVNVTIDGRLQERFWTYSINPVAEGDGGSDCQADGASVGMDVGGVLLLITDTTAQVSAARRQAGWDTQRYSFVDRLPGFVGILRGPDHVFEYVNASYEAFVGRRDLIGHTARERFPELDGQGFFEMLDGVYASGLPVILHAVPIRFEDQKPDQFMDLRYDPIHDENGEIDGIFVSGHDLTERVQAETRRAMLAALSERLRDLQTPSEIAFAAAELIGRTMQVSRAGYGTIDPQAETLQIDRDWNAPGIEPLPATVSLRNYGWFIDDLKRGTDVVIADAERDPRTMAVADALQQHNARSFATVPVMEQDDLVAVLYLGDDRVRAWSDEDMAFVREVAERTRTAVERSRSDLALRALTASLEQQVEQRTRERDRLWETSEDLLAIAGDDGALFRISPSWTRCLGYDEQALLAGGLMSVVHPDDAATLLEHIGRMIDDRRPARFESRLVGKDGTWRWIAWSLVPEITVPRINAVGRDVTVDHEAASARALLEDQLRQAQKMEAVGQLTGGIAHDFNNMILGVTGSLQIARRRLTQGRADEIEVFIDRAKNAADRAAALTHRLLAFARRQPLDPRTIDANALIGSLDDLFRRTIGERITLRLVAADDLGPILCDPHRLESSLLNLVLNARDAMVDGGTLTIATRNVDVAAADVATLPDVTPGHYVCICVHDDGAGMSAETAARAFEPFFTNKPIGRGTGLGLSMVYGFARQSNGFARICSTPGKGTTVALYLPRHHGTPGIDPTVHTPVAAPRASRHETILVIEDDAIVRALVVDVLSEIGYRVLQAPDGAIGLALLRSDVAIDLLVTDIGLPDIDGREVAQAARSHRAALKILFMTGYAETAATAPGFVASGMALITKPFDIDKFIARVGAMIEA